MTEEVDAIVVSLTPEEHEALGNGESVLFEYPVHIVEKEPKILVEVEEDE